nr:putative gamma-glutamylcyclotransferase CG2811 [Rhipicephalus microplus]
MTHCVFVYGTLKSGETNHRILTDPANGHSTFLGEAKTLKKWPLVLVSPYEIPCLLPCEGLGHEVRGEVYQVDDRMLEVLDRLESHPDYYVRSQEDILMLSQPKSPTGCTWKVHHQHHRRRPETGETRGSTSSASSSGNCCRFRACHSTPESRKSNGRSLRATRPHEHFWTTSFNT